MIDERGDLGAQLGRVGLPCAQHKLDAGIEQLGRAQQHRQAFLPGDPAYVDDGRAVGLDAVLGEQGGAGVGGVLAGVDAVADDVHSLGLDGGVGREHVGAHAVGYGDDGGGRFDRDALAPG